MQLRKLLCGEASSSSSEGDERLILTEVVVAPGSPVKQIRTDKPISLSDESSEIKAQESPRSPRVMELQQSEKEKVGEDKIVTSEVLRKSSREKIFERKKSITIFNHGGLMRRKSEDEAALSSAGVKESKNPDFKRL